MVKPMDFQSISERKLIFSPNLRKTIEYDNRKLVAVNNGLEIHK